MSDDEKKPHRPPRRYEDYDDEDYDEPLRRHPDDDGTGGLIPYKNPQALWAYYCAIFGFFLPLIGGIIAIVLGVKGLAYAKKHPRARGQVHAWIGILGGSFDVLFWLLCGGGILISLIVNR